MKIHEPSLEDLIKSVGSGHLQLPQFQRPFVWEVGKIHQLVVSFFKQRPIGMATSWLQPQNKPHTTPTRFSIPDQPECYFGNFSDLPAVISLVLDGRQRITTLLHVFTADLCPRNGKFTHANRWFLNLDKDLGDDDSVEWCKTTKLSERKLDSVANAISQGRFPLSEMFKAVKSGHLFHDSGTYPAGSIPDKETIEKRQDTLQRASDVLKAFKFPIAQIGDEFDLSDVCEIFEILNTTGTRISTFDLIHNSLFGNAGENYSLREVRKEHTSTEAGMRIFGSQAEEYYCQFVTTCWIAASGDNKLAGKDGVRVDTLKKSNLLQTPLEAFKEIGKAFDEGKIEDALAALDKSVGGAFKLEDAAYPVSITLFFGAWLTADSEQGRARLCELFRAYYYRNSLLKRYTQGYLSKHSSDLKFLRETIRIMPDAEPESWRIEADNRLKKHFLDDVHFVAEENIRELLLSGERPEGAAGGLLKMHLLTHQKADLITGAPLDIFVPSQKPQAVELHHIFPKKFLQLTAANYPDQLASVDCLANLVPLTRDSNNKWSAKGPSTALKEMNKTWENSEPQFNQAKIDCASFEILAQTTPYSPDDIANIWQSRAKGLATEIFSAQFLAKPGPG